MKKKIEFTAGVGSNLLATALLVLFIALKLTGVINWSWIWVLSPLWIPLALAGIILLVFLIIFKCIMGKRL